MPENSEDSLSIAVPAKPVLDQQTQAFLAFLKNLNRPALHTLPVEEARQQFLKGQARVPLPNPAADVESLTIPAGPKGSIPIHIIRPVGSKEVLPVVMYFHGGGWVLGNFESHERKARELCVGTGAAVIFVDYTLSPEARYPVANEEAYAATKWIAEHGRERNLDPERIAVAGESAGGNMAIVVTMLAKERGGPKIAAQALFYPATGGSPDTSSRKQFCSGYFFTEEEAQWFWQHYSNGEPIHHEVHGAPLRASIDQLKDLPPALVITAECDVLRDEGEAYASKLLAAGVPVIGTRYLGTIHGFTVANALATSAAARAAVAQACAMLRENLKIEQATAR